MKPKKKVNPTEKKVVLTTFLLLFPSLVIAAIAASSNSIGYAVISLALWFYQAIVIQNYVKSNIQE